ncbi:MAG: RNA polymerase sigma factor [Anaerolineae bacterium]|nr:RNA polymerase sigma factor [Gemmatimonadaceae bacterium]
MNDSAIIKRVLGGHSEAFALLVDRYHERSIRYARSMLRDPRDAEEAVQDAFVRAYRSLDRYEDSERFGAWLMRILLNRCRTAGGQADRRNKLFIVGDDTDVSAGEAHPAERTAWREEIDRALAMLDPDQREAFLLKHVEELDYDEMSGITGVGVSALKMRVKRACERLRDMLREVRSA